HSTAPSGSFHIVEHSDGSRSSYHESDLSPHEPDDDDDDDDQDHMAKSKPVMLVRADMLKAQVKAYTRKDGTFVKEHTTSVQAAAPKPAADHQPTASLRIETKHHGDWGDADSDHAGNRVKAEEDGFKQSGYKRLPPHGHEFTYAHDDGRKRVIRV
ncbi:hypothetical protein RZS08_28425, partial [Arthrospira platensis SPKY1]|nr:hypothetical protein [Arthrospira platensis SPKY1]